MIPGRTRIEERLDPYAALAVAVLAVSTSAILVRASDAPEPVMAFYRVLFMAALLVPFLRDRMGAFPSPSRRDALAAGAAGVALAAHFLAWFASVDLTSIAASVTLVQTQTVFVAAGAAALLGERITARIVAGILVAVGGTALLSVSGDAAAGSAPLAGNALALAGAVLAAAYVLAGRSLRQRVPLIPYVLVVYGTCAATLLVVVLLGDQPLAGYPPREWLLFLGMAIGPGLLGHTVVNWALKRVESSVVSVALVGEPVGSTLLAALLFGEIPGPRTVLGGAVVLAGILIVARAHGAG